SCRLAHAPEERHWPLRDAGNRFPPSLMLYEKSEWRVKDVIDGCLVHPARGGHFLIEGICIKPSHDLGFHLRAVRPSEERPLTIGAIGIASGIGVERAGIPIEVGLPSALAGRRFLRPASDHTAPVRCDQINLDAEACEEGRN